MVERRAFSWEVERAGVGEVASFRGAFKWQELRGRKFLQSVSSLAVEQAKEEASRR